MSLPPLPPAWVEALFGKLAIRYGAPFVQQYDGLKLEAVKADWAEVLAGLKGDAIAHALEHLPERPVNAMQFRALCSNAPRPAVRALPPPDVDPAGLRRIVAALRAVRAGMRVESAGEKAARRRAEIREAIAAGNATEAQAQWLDDCERADQHPDAPPSGSFSSIAEHLWPPGMRDGGIARDFAAELLARHEAGEWVDPVRLSAAQSIAGRAVVADARGVASVRNSLAARGRQEVDA